eukprot:366191-Chlamydomonas_euryale.AAC.6
MPHFHSAHTWPAGCFLDGELFCASAAARPRNTLHTPAIPPTPAPPHTTFPHLAPPQDALRFPVQYTALCERHCYVVHTPGRPHTNFLPPAPAGRAALPRTLRRAMQAPLLRRPQPRPSPHQLSSPGPRRTRCASPHAAPRYASATAKPCRTSMASQGRHSRLTSAVPSAARRSSWHVRLTACWGLISPRRLWTPQM